MKQLKDFKSQIRKCSKCGICQADCPIYKITGNGPCTLTVNGKTMTATVTDNISIDTERMITYDSSGNLKNTSVSGNYEDLYLQPGENTVTVSSGFTCTVIPNWRCL